MTGQYPMPVAWDGIPVTWTKWEPAAHICQWIDEYDESGHPLTRQVPCGHCHLPSGLWQCEGTQDYTQTGVARIGGVPTLYATRCDRCAATTVTDLIEEKTWDLDEDDYTDAGSWETPR